MNDTQEMASVADQTAKITPSTAVADLLRTHPSKPAPAPSPLLRSALGFSASQDGAGSADLGGSDAGEAPDDRDALSPARGILMGLALMLPFWGAVGFAIRSALR